MRIFQMRDPTPIEAFVLAADYGRARELFQRHLHAHGGDPDTLLYRELTLEHLDEPEFGCVSVALDVRQEGLVASDALGRWVFIMPVGMDSADLDDD
jgi:hypothetical protein